VVLVSSWRARAFVLGVLVGCTVVGITASAAAAALPDSRAWELVSPVNKLGNDIAGDTGRTYASAGESPGSPAAASFVSIGGFADVHGTGLVTEYLAQRDGRPGTNGWVTHGITPRQDPLSLLAIPNNFEPGYRAFAADLSKGVYRSWSPGLTDAPNVAHVPNLYVRGDLRTPGEGFYQLITNAPTLLPPPRLFDPNNQPQFPVVADSTRDMEHLLFESTQNLTNDARGTAIKLYKVDGATTRLIAANPDCGEAVGQCSSVGATRLIYTLRVLSADGSRVTFANNPGSRLFQLDDRGTAATNDDALVQVNTSESLTPDAVTAPAQYAIASMDGSRVFFISDEDLTGARVNGLYMWARQDTNQTQQVSVNATGGTYTLTFRSQIIHGAGDLTNGSNTITGANGPFIVGQTLTTADPTRAAEIPAGTRITAISGNTLTLSRNMTADLAGERLEASLDSTTGPLPPAGASAAQLQTALGALSGIGVGNVTVSSPSAGTYDVTFSGGLAGVNVAQLTADPTNLTGGTATTSITTPIHNLTRIAQISGGVIGASNDGHHLYFATISGLAGDPPTGGRSIYYWHDGTLSFVGAVRPADLGPVTNIELWIFNPKVSRVSPDGRTLMFELVDGTGLVPRYDGNTCPQSLNPNNSGRGCSQVFVYRADRSRPDRPDVVCASCPPRGTPVTDSAWFTRRTGSSVTFLTFHLNHVLSDDGRFVFFSSTDPLLPEDTNGKFDAYEYDIVTGTTSLLSTGKDPSDSFFMDASDDGHDAYFVTRQRLVGWDTDSAYDLYDARVNGGFPDPPAAAPECTGSACQGPSTTPLPVSPLASNTFNGLGNETPARPAHRTTRCKRGKVKRRIHGRTRCIKRRHHKARHHRTRRHARH
jgi:hypothetical protein